PSLCGGTDRRGSCREIMRSRVSGHAERVCESVQKVFSKKGGIGTDEETMENTPDRVRSTRRSRDCHGGGRNHPGRADQEYRWREETGNMAGQYQGELDGSWERSAPGDHGKAGGAGRGIFFFRLYG